MTGQSANKPAEGDIEAGQGLHPQSNGAQPGPADEHERDEDGKAPAKDFVQSTGLSSSEASDLLVKWGRNELEEKRTPKWLVFLQQLYAPMPIMIWIAVIVEAAIENWPDMGILLGIQFINAFLGWYETTKAGDAVAALKASLKPESTCKRDGKWQTLDASLLVPGDLVLLASGAAVPADCLVNAGQIDVDQSALTGESLPVTMYRGDAAKMGSTVARGEVEGTVELTGKGTFFGKTATLLQQGGELGHLQKILLRIMGVLVVTSLALCITVLVYLLCSGERIKDALSFTVVLIVASIPIAIEIVCTTTLALGSRMLAKHGAIVTRLGAIEDMAGMNMLCSDKTGTLTLNKMVIQAETPTYLPDLDQAQVLRYAALAAKWHEPARDALDTLVLGAVDMPSLDQYTQTAFMPFDPTVKRTEGTLRCADGSVFKTTKGAPHVISKLCSDQSVVGRVNAQVESFGQRGIRSLAVAKTDSAGVWQMAGLLTFLDPPRPDTRETVERALAYGVDVKMLTGDHLLIAKETARQLGMGTNIQDAAGLPSLEGGGKVPDTLGAQYGEMIMHADGFAQVYPEHKYLIVAALRQCGFAVGMTGDGVNDAPALKRADVGVAVQGATDAARAAADIVLTQPGLSTVIEAIVIARCVFQRVKNFINYRIAATLQLLVFFFIAVFALRPRQYQPARYDHLPDDEQWPAFFKMPVLMLMLITLLNDGTLISIGYDNVTPGHMPEKWNLPALFLISIVLGAVACGSSLLLLWAALDSWNPTGIFAHFHLPGQPYGHITTLIYLKVSISDFLTLFSARTHAGFFWSVRPSPILLIAAGVALSLSTALACIWPKGHTDGILSEGLAYGDYTLLPLWTWVYCIFWWFVQDTLKVLAYWVMHRYNILDINNAHAVNLRDATSAFDKRRPLAHASVGLTDTKLLQRRLERTSDKVVDMARTSQTADASHLRRLSQSLQRASRTLGGSALGVAEAANMGQDPEAAAFNFETEVQRLTEATHALPTQMQDEIAPNLRGVREAADRLAATRSSQSHPGR
ncbi:MAG: hypothetical protein WDW36_005903 [Sanguina aurantia]